MQKYQRNFIIVFIIVSVTILSCSTGQLLGPSLTPSASITPAASPTPSLTETPIPTQTNMPTETPLPAILADGTNSWPISLITMENSAPIGDQDVAAENGQVYLKIVFSNPNHKLLPFPNLPGSTDSDYSKVSIHDNQGNKYIVVSDRLDLTIGLDGTVTLSDLSLWFQSMPAGSSGFQLFFADLAPIDLGNGGNKPVAAGKNQGGGQVIPPTAPSTSSGASFSEDFSSNAKGWETGEESTDGGTVKRTILDGKYDISMTSKQDYYYVLLPIPAFSGENYSLTIDATVLESTVTAGDMTLEFSMRQVDGVSGRQYNVILGDDGSSTLDLWPNDNYQDVISLWNTPANSLFKLEKGVNKNISIRMDGPKISASSDGRIISSVTDTTVAGEGGINLGICLYNAGQSLRIVFDNLSIQEIR
jgi:hypothetical protein